MRPVIDSHVHLFDQQGLTRLAWMTPTNRLNHPHTIQDYTEAATGTNLDLEGIVFIETDVRSGLEQSQWSDAVDEYAFVVDCEKTHDKPQRLVKAIIPWAPLPSGRDAVISFIARLKVANADGYSLVKGFRYLLQDKPPGTMLQAKFIEALEWISQEGYIFEVGIDMHSRGVCQLEEFCELDKRVSGLKFILNHLTKPNLTSTYPLDLEVIKAKWRTIAQNTNNEFYVKLSGLFSEMPEDIVNGDVHDIIKRVKPWLSLFVEVFGPEKIIWGSDWPVCTTKMRDTKVSWRKWEDVCLQLTSEVGLSDQIYYENVKSAYNLD